MKCVVVLNCQYVQPLPIREMPISCGSKVRRALASPEGWRARLFRYTSDVGCKKRKAFYVVSYVNNVVIPMPADAALNPLDYARSILEKCRDGYGRPLSSLVHTCHVRAVYCAGVADEGKVAALIAAWGVVAVSKSSVALPYGRIRGDCVELKFEARSLSHIPEDALRHILALAKYL